MSDRQQLEQSIIALEAQRAVLGNNVDDTMLAAAREKLANLELEQSTEQQRKQATILFSDVSGFTAMS